MWAPGLLLAIAAVVGLTGMLLYSGLIVVGIPLFVVGVAAIGAIELSRRRRQVGSIADHRRQAKAEEVEFSERDRQTLAS